jgi:hypothetical protein
MRKRTNQGGAWRRAGSAALLILLAGACGGDARPPEEKTVAVPNEPIPARPGTFHGVGVALTGLAIRTDQPTVPEGDVSFSVTNAGAQPYTLVVTGEGVELRTDPVAPGGTALLNASLKPGTYVLRTEPEQAGPVPGEIRRTLRVTGGD